jgi:excisionase family DNA binding protein
MSTASASAAPQEARSEGVETPPSVPDDRLLRASEVQRELGVSRATAYRMMNDGTLPIYRFGGRNGARAMIRVSFRELRAWIAAHRTAQLSRTGGTC